MNESQFKEIMEKVKEMKRGGSVDLSLDEDLSIAVMNLVSLEEHFFFTAEKTGKDEYLDLLRETREMRKELLGELIDSNEGETWCISKHLLAATMRLMEVGTKLEGAGKREEAKRMFGMSYKVYALFWGLRLKLIGTKDIKKISDDKLNKHDAEGSGDKPFDAAQDKPWKYEDLVEKLINCCEE